MILRANAYAQAIQPALQAELPMARGRSRIALLRPKAVVVNIFLGAGTVVSMAAHVCGSTLAIKKKFENQQRFTILKKM